MKNERIGKLLFWLGLILAITFAGVIGRSLYHNLRTLTMEELSATVWADGGPLWISWAMSVTLGSIIAAIGAFTYVKTKAIFSWLTAIGVFVSVFVMVVIYTKVYIPTLFGIGGILNLLAFFAIVWIWMKKYAGLSNQEKVAGSFKLIGYIFWINATWFICGESAKMHLKAFDGAGAPSPIEIMVFLVLGWIFVLIGDYRGMRLRSH